MAEDTHSFLAKLEESTALRYALAPICIGVALLVHLSPIGPFPHPNALFLACIVAAAWLGGAGPGFLAALLATLVMPQLVPMRYQLTAGFFDLPRFLTFGIIGVAVGWGTTSRRRAETALRRSELELRQARNELEMKVLEQTAELRRSEALLAEAQKLSQTGSFGWKVSTGEIFWSEETFRIYGYDRTTKPAVELIRQRVHPEDVALVKQTIDRASQDAKDFDYEYRLLMPSGSVKYVHVVAHAVSDESGNIEFIGAVMDVTERKRAEETLRRSEAYLAEAQRLSHTASFAYNPGRRKTLYWSEELFRIFGLDPQRGVPDYNETRRLVHPDDLDRVSGECLQGFREKADFTQDYRLLLHDGTIKHLHVIWHPVLDNEGELIEYVGTAADVTERKSAEQALRRSAALLAEGQRISHTGSFGWNVATDEHFWSDETFRIFEYDASTKITLQLILERVHPEDIPLVQQVIARAADGKDLDLEYRLLMPSGSIKHLHVVAHAIRDESGSIEFIGAVLDVTERKQAEEALRRSQSELAHVTRVMTMGELIASIAHEINQPLAAVVTNANACLRWLAAPIPNLDEAREAVARIARDGKRASDVIGRIRALVKKSSTERAYLDVNEVIKEVVGLLQRELQRNGVVLRTELAADLPYVLGDRVQLQQVILNLVMNGIEAMSGVTDRSRGLFIRSRQHGADKVLVAVQDSGMGIDRENVEKIFNAFYTTKSQGMGMGLAISRSIVENHGGQLWAAPNDGPGATFQFTLDIGIEEESKRVE